MANVAATPAMPAQTAPPAPATPEPIVIPLEGGGDPIFPFQPPDTGNAHVVTARRMIPRTTAALGATTPAAEVRRQWPPVMHSADEAEDTNGGITPFSNWPSWPTDRSEEILSTPQVESAPKPTGNPDHLIGMTQKEALDWLEAHNWVSGVDRDWSDEPYGVVFDYESFAGKVTILVSRGPAPEETTPAPTPVLDNRTVERMREQVPPHTERWIREVDAGTLPPTKTEILTLREDQEPETVKEASPSSPPESKGVLRWLGNRLKSLGPSDEFGKN